MTTYAPRPLDANDPALDGPDRIDWRPVARALRAAPGVWHYITSEGRRVVPAHIRRGSPKAFGPPGSFDARVVGGALYARFVGEPLEPWHPELGRDAEPRAWGDLERHPIGEEQSAPRSRPPAPIPADPAEIDAAEAERKRAKKAAKKARRAAELAEQLDTAPAAL